MSLRLGELCAGYGGLGMAVEEVFGAESAWFSEFDAAPSKILAHHWPDVPNYGDMTKIDWAAIEPVDIISGGTPCQDLSAAGARRGMTEGTRSNLWVQMREAIAIQQPTYVVWENVRGAYSATAASDLEQCPGCMGDTTDGGVILRALGRVLGDLSDLGYDTQWRGLRAADVGACHGRFRVFVLAVDSGRIGRAQTVKHHGRSPSTDYRAALLDQSDRHALRLGSKRGSTVQDSDVAARSERRLAAPGQAQGGGTWADAGGRSGAPAPDSYRRDDAGRIGDKERCSINGTPTPRCGEVTRADIFKGIWCACELTPDATSARRPEGKDCGASSQDESEGAWGGESQRGDRERTNWGDYEPAIRRWERTIGRAAPRPTEPSGRNSAHRLSPRFTEWMMGLPDGWVTDPAIGISRNEQLKACGNGVVPQQAIAALRDMLAAFEEATAA